METMYTSNKILNILPFSPVEFLLVIISGHIFETDHIFLSLKYYSHPESTILTQRLLMNKEYDVPNINILNNSTHTNIPFLIIFRTSPSFKTKNYSIPHFQQRLAKIKSIPIHFNVYWLAVTIISSQIYLWSFAKEASTHAMDIPIFFFHFFKTLHLKAKSTNLFSLLQTKHKVKGQFLEKYLKWENYHVSWFLKSFSSFCN